MAALAINDLPMNRALDRKAMSCIKGAGGAPWVFGAFRAFVPKIPAIGPVIHFYQTNNIFIADQINNQFQTIEVNNSASNSNITVDADQQALNFSIA